MTPSETVGSVVDLGGRVAVFNTTEGTVLRRTQPDLDSLLTPEQAAAWWQCPLTRAKKLLAGGCPGSVRVGRSYRLHPRTWLAKKGCEQ